MEVDFRALVATKPPHMGSPISPFPGMHQSPISNPSLGSARHQAEPLPSLQSESESGSSVSPSSGMHQSPNPIPSLGSRPNQLAPVSSLQSNSEAGSDEEGTLLHVSFNQDSGCLACGTSQGFRVYSCDPFKETLRRNFSNGGIGIVEMLFRSNILALVGGGTSPQFPSNKVMIWDDHQSRCIGELSFRSEVRAVKLRRDRIVVVLEQKIYVYNFADLKLLNHIETLSNPKGLCVLSHAPDASVLACPGLHCGQVRVEHYGLKRSKFIPAHDSDIACLALTLDGLLLATASTKGTLIRIFNTLDGTRMQEVRRGADRAEIYSIALSQNAQWLAVSSDKGTIHIFGVKVLVAGEQSNVDSMQGSPGTCNSQSGDSRIIPYAGSNPGSSFSFMKGVLPKYFSSEWSFAQFHLLEGTRYLVAFGQKNTIVIVGIDGSFYKCVFDPAHGGPMLEQEYTRFFKSDKATVN